MATTFISLPPASTFAGQAEVIIDVQAIQFISFDLSPVTRLLKARVVSAGTIAQFLLAEATKDWEHQPTFTITGPGELTGLMGSAATPERMAGAVYETRYFGQSSGSYGVAIFTKDPVFVAVDRGTKGHWIAPKEPVGRSGRPTALQFRAGYRAKSPVQTPGAGVKASNPGGHYGPYRYATQVWHPGIAPRNITFTVAAQVQSYINANVLRDIQDGLYHGVRQ